MAGLSSNHFATEGRLDLIVVTLSVPVEVGLGLVTGEAPGPIQARPSSIFWTEISPDR